MKTYDYPIIVIGAGAGGLVVAIGAARAGKKVLLVEKGTYGGDCTNFGCIPSKSLIASAHGAHAIQAAESLGIEVNSATLNCDGALKRTREIVAEISSHEDPEALKKIGVETITGTARFENPHTLVIGDKRVTGRNIVIATGSTPAIPEVQGLDKVSYLTNETVFDLDKIPKRLGVIGGGPIGCELAQAFSRLGAEVTLIQHGPHLLKKEEREAQKGIEKQFIKEGIDLHLECEILEVNQKDVFEIKLPEKTVTVDKLLVATGRKPNIEKLDLERASVATYPQGIVVDKYGRTSQKHIFAVGDVTGRALFTHIAENEARSVLTTLLMPGPLKSRLDLKHPVPRVTYTDPEVAACGMQEEEATKKFGRNKIAVYTVPFESVDRAITSGRRKGFVKVVTKKWSSKILGVTIVAERAGEMLPELTLAMRSGIPLRKLASLIHPYPTYSLAIRKAADQWLSQTIIPTVLKWIGKKR